MQYLHWTWPSPWELHAGSITIHLLQAPVEEIMHSVRGAARQAGWRKAATLHRNLEGVQFGVDGLLLYACIMHASLSTRGFLDTSSPIQFG